MYIVFFFQTIRLGLWVGRHVGPFNSIEEASNWVRDLELDHAKNSLNDETESFLPSWSIVKLYKD
jgi:hypothetical protein